MSNYRHMIQYPRKTPETPHLVIMWCDNSMAGIDVSGVSEEGRKQFGDAIVKLLEDAEGIGRFKLQSELCGLLGTTLNLDDLS